jgi:hypothetical protein
MGAGRFRTLISFGLLPAMVVALVSVPGASVNAETPAAPVPRVEVAPAAVRCPVTPSLAKPTPARQAPAGRPIRAAVRAAAEPTYAAPDAPRRMIPGDE